MAARRTERTTRTVTRETRATSRMAEGDETEEAPQPALDLPAAMGIVTFLLLVASIVLTDYLLGKHYGAGMFFA